MANEPVFNRILLKLSGEALMGSLDYGTDPEQIDRISGQVHAVSDRGVEVALVVGAATSTAASMPRPRAWTGPPRTTWGCWRR